MMAISFPPLVCIHASVLAKLSQNIADYGDIWSVKSSIKFSLMLKTFSPCSWKASLALISSSVFRFWKLEKSASTSGEEVNNLRGSRSRWYELRTSLSTGTTGSTSSTTGSDFDLSSWTPSTYWTNMVTPVVCSSLLIPFHCPFNRNLCLLPRPRGWGSSCAATSPPPPWSCQFHFLDVHCISSCQWVSSD